MKDTVNVSIAGIAFILDRDCYSLLNQYLSDKTSDAEVRIAEEILSIQGADKPVSMNVLRPIIDAMGGYASSDYEHPREQQPNTIAKRLFRNPEGAMLAGVCSGLATYLDASVILFRLIFLLPLFFGGFLSIWQFPFLWGSTSLSSTLLLIYIILWVAIPKAKTPLQKLEMRDNKPSQDKSTVSTISVSILKVFAIVIACTMLFSALTGTIIAFAKLSIEINTHNTPIPTALDMMHISYMWASICLSAIALLPVLAICYLIFSGVFGFRHTKIVMGITFFIWFALIVFAFILVISNIGELSTLNDWGNNRLDIY